MKSAPGDMLLSVPTTRTCHIKVSGKLGKGREAGTTLSPHKLEEVLPVKKVLFTNPSARAGYDTRSIFKRSLTGLNSEFSFS